jgi:hypothetical protein
MFPCEKCGFFMNQQGGFHQHVAFINVAGDWTIIRRVVCSGNPNPLQFSWDDDKPWTIRFQEMFLDKPIRWSYTFHLFKAGSTDTGGFPGKKKSEIIIPNKAGSFTTPLLININQPSTIIYQSAHSWWLQAIQFIVKSLSKLPKKRGWHQPLSLAPAALFRQTEPQLGLWKFRHGSSVNLAVGKPDLFIAESF